MKITTLIRKRNKARENGIVLGRSTTSIIGVRRTHNKPRMNVRVMSNIQKPWWGKQAMTPNLWRE